MCDVISDDVISDDVLGRYARYQQKGWDVGRWVAHPEGENSMVVSLLGYVKISPEVGWGHFPCFK